MSNLLKKEYSEVSYISGPLLFLENAPDLAYNAIVRIKDAKGRERGGPGRDGRHRPHSCPDERCRAGFYLKRGDRERRTVENRHSAGKFDCKRVS